MANLKLVIVICRHGDRTPLQSYPTNPYKSQDYYPYGNGELTNKGKKRMFDLGVQLRQQYDSFLGDVYHPENLKIVTSNINRTKMTAQLVSAGLFPPPSIQKWHETINWQPIPYSYSINSHYMLVSPVHRCEKYRQVLKEIEKSEHGLELLQKFAPTLKYMEEESGLKPFGIQDAFFMCMILNAEESLGLQLPEWTKEIYPHPLEEIACYQYLLETYTLKMKQETIGQFLAELLQDCEKKIIHDSKVKFILYSAHECTLAYLLIILNVFDLRVPKYGAYITLELSECNKEYNIQVFYHNSDEERKLIKIPDLKELCTYESFKEYISQYIGPPKS